MLENDILIKPEWKFNELSKTGFKTTRICYKISLSLFVHPTGKINIHVIQQIYKYKTVVNVLMCLNSQAQNKRIAKYKK